MGRRRASDWESLLLLAMLVAFAQLVIFVWWLAVALVIFVVAALVIGGVASLVTNIKRQKSIESPPPRSVMTLSAARTAKIGLGDTVESKHFGQGVVLADKGETLTVSFKETGPTDILRTFVWRV